MVLVPTSTVFSKTCMEFYTCQLLSSEEGLQDTNPVFACCHCILAKNRIYRGILSVIVMI